MKFFSRKGENLWKKEKNINKIKHPARLPFRPPLASQKGCPPLRGAKLGGPGLLKALGAKHSPCFAPLALPQGEGKGWGWAFVPV